MRLLGSMRSGKGARSAILLLASLFVLGTAVSAEVIKRTFRTRSNPTIRLHHHTGTISVRGWDQNQVEVRAEPSSQATVSVQGEEDKVVVEAHPAREGAPIPETQVNFEIRVPKQSMVWVESERGSIAIENIAGTVSVEAVSNSVGLSNVVGNITVHTLDGPIVIRASEGHIKADSSTGDLKFEQVNGTEISGTTNTGAISYLGDFGSGGTYVLRNYSSPINIATSRNASFDIMARALQGKVQNDLPFLRPFQRGTPFAGSSPENFLQGRSNTGKSTVQVITYSGTIRLYSTQ